MWCNILTKPKQGSFFREFRGNLMNVPKEYDDEEERPRTHPLLLPKEDIPGTMTATDKVVLKKTNDKILFAPNVSFAQRKPLRRSVRRIPKPQGTKKKSVLQRVTQRVVSPLVHRMNVLGDRGN